MDFTQTGLCRLCPRECNANRSVNPIDKKSICKAPNEVKIALVSLHKWEEPCLSGKNGAGTVFFSHCNLRCCFCQNFEISSNGFGITVGFERLVEIFLEQQSRGATCLELVSSSHYSDVIARALARAKSIGLTIPVALNSNGYEKIDSLKKLEGLVDIYLPDLKYFDSKLGAKYSGAPHYFEVASLAIKEMVRQQPVLKLTSEGLLLNGVIVRHLVLPSHYTDSLKVVTWVHENFQDKVYLSLMNQYIPLHHAYKHKEINRKLTTLEYQKVVRYARKIGVTRGFIQEGATSKSKFIPVFDGSHVLPGS